MEIQELFNAAMAVVVLLASFVLNSIRTRLDKLEKNSIPEELCRANHRLDEERISNLLSRTEDSDKRNVSDHEDLKSQLGDIYGTLDKIKSCVYRLAGQTSRKGDPIDEE